MTGAGRLILPGLSFLALISVALSGCGDSLSSLEAVQRGSRRVFPMLLSPDYGRRGKTLLVEVVEMDAELDELLGQSVAYPTEISFGKEIFIKSFGTNPDKLLEIEVFISPLAKTGERNPALVFSVDGELVEARGKFFVLPAKPE